MSLRLTAALQGRLGDVIAAEARAMATARGRATRQTTTDIKAGFRQAITAGTRGRKLANAVRDKVYSEAGEVEAGIVYSNARKRGARGQVVDLIDVLSRGATIRPARGSWLMVPNPAFARTRSGGYSRRGLNRTQGKLRQAAAGGAAAANIAFIPIRGGAVVMIVERKGGARATRSTILGFLVRSVRIKAQYDLQRVLTRAEGAYPERLLAAWQAALPE
ncbi:MAG: hypothetical protein WD673_03955 [Alphaproteobacteria bacterium]